MSLGTWAGHPLSHQFGTTQWFIPSWEYISNIPASYPGCDFGLYHFRQPCWLHVLLCPHWSLSYKQNLPEEGEVPDLQNVIQLQGRLARQSTAAAFNLPEAQPLGASQPLGACGQMPGLPQLCMGNKEYSRGECGGYTAGDAPNCCV